MLTTKQFTILMLVAILSAACSAFIVIGIFSRDFSFAAINFLMLIGVFIAGIYVSRPPNNRAGDIKIEGEINPELKDK